MQKLMILLSLVAAALLGGCVMNPVPPMDPRVTIAEDLGWDVYVTDVRFVKTTGGYLVAQANVVNNTPYDLGVEWKVQWLDATGLEIDSVVSSWNKLVIAAKEIRALKGVAPQLDAADMRLYVRPLR